MKTTAEKMNPSVLIARPCPDSSELADPRAFAWEILRRRADYQGVPAAIDWLGTAIAPLELIRPLKATNKWGLRFRRRP